MVIEDSKKVDYILGKVDSFANDRVMVPVMLENLYTTSLSDGDDGENPREVMSFDIKDTGLYVSIEYYIEGKDYYADYVKIKIHAMKKMWYESDRVNTLDLATKVLNKLNVYLYWKADKEYADSKVMMRSKMSECGIK